MYVGNYYVHVHVLFSCGPHFTILFSQHLPTCACTCIIKPVPIIFFTYQMKIIEQ